jgi:hypothetical protein
MSNIKLNEEEIMNIEQSAQNDFSEVFLSILKISGGREELFPVFFIAKGFSPLSNSLLLK